VNSASVMGKVGQFNVCFRAEQLTSHAGVVLVHELAQQLGVEQRLEEEREVKQRERGYCEGQALGALVYTLLLGGECLRDLEVLRGDPGTPELRGQEAVLAPRPTGELWPKFEIGDLRDLPRVNLRLPQRVRPPQSAATCTRDLDSSLSEQASPHPEGLSKAENGEVGSPPLWAVWAEEGELLFSHLRRGSVHPSRNVRWLLTAMIKRVPPPARLHLRADRGFSRNEVGQWGETPLKGKFFSSPAIFTDFLHTCFLSPSCPRRRASRRFVPYGAGFLDSRLRGNDDSALLSAKNLPLKGVRPPRPASPSPLTRRLPSWPALPPCPIGVGRPCAPIPSAR
jgi:hypothetical protein